jgi:hypothetical protein
MWRTVRNLALSAVVAFATAAQPAEGQARSDSSRIPRIRSPLLTTNRALHASLQRISRGSPLWREAVEAVGKTGRLVLVLTSAEAAITDRDGGQERAGFDQNVLAEAVPILGDDLQISVVVVVVNLQLVQEIHDARLSVPRDFEADLDRILVHEVFGHAVPYLLAGDRSGRCADPEPQESASDACSIRRENAVRAELGLGRRADHGLHSLRLALGTR